MVTSAIIQFFANVFISFMNLAPDFGFVQTDLSANVLELFRLIGFFFFPSVLTAILVGTLGIAVFRLVLGVIHIIH